MILLQNFNKNKLKRLLFLSLVLLLLLPFKTGANSIDQIQDSGYEQYTKIPHHEKSIIAKVNSLSFKALKKEHKVLIDSFYIINNRQAEVPYRKPALSFLAKYYFEHSRFEDARMVFEQILLNGKEEKDWKEMAEAHNFGSLIAELEEQYMDMYFHNQQLLAIGEKYDPIFIAMANLNLGGFYLEMGDNKAAEKKYKEGLAIFKNIPQNLEYGWLLHRLGEYYRVNKNFELSKDYLLKAQEFWEKESDKRAANFTLLQLGIVYSDLDDTKRARNTFQKALKEGKENGFWLSQINVLLALGKFENEQGNFVQAIKYLEQATTLSVEKKIPYHFKASYESLAKAYQATGQIQKANTKYQEFLSEIQKEIKSGIKARMEWAKSMDNLYEKELAYELLKQTEMHNGERLKAQQMVILFGTLLLALIGWTAFSYFQSNKKNLAQKEVLGSLNEKIQQQSNELKTANESILSRKKELEVKLLKNLMVLSKKAESNNALAKCLEKMEICKETLAMKRIIENSQNDTLWEELDVQITQANSDFFERLSKKFDHLTKGDLRLCALLKMNLRTKEIANLTFKNPESVKVARSRLRKKIGLTHSNTDLSAFLNQV